MALLGLVTSFIGLTLGGILALLAERSGPRWSGLLAGFAGGLFLSYVSMAMLPKSFAASGLYPGLLAVLVGVGLFFLLESWTGGDGKQPGFIRKFRCAKPAPEPRRPGSSGFLLSAGFLIHRIPEGLALGALGRVDPAAALVLAVFLALHALPEGLLTALPLLQNGLSFGKLLLVFAGLAAALGAGALLGGTLGELLPSAAGLCVGFAGGIMLAVACGEVLPSAVRERGKAGPVAAIVLGLAAGLAAAVLG